MARHAFCWLASANSSICWRLKFHCSAIISADRPCGTRLYFSIRLGGSGPMSAPIGTRVMFSTPPATTRSCAPALTACAAKFTACWPEPQKRFSVTPGHLDRPAGREHRAARDVGALLAGLGDAADDDVVDFPRIDARCA